MRDRALGDEQRAAFRYVTSNRDLALVAGYAGTGKSTTSAARRPKEASGYTVRGAALSGIAAEAREGGSGIKSRTIASLEHAWGHGRDQLTKRDVLVIDEAGMVGSRQMERVLSNAAEAGAKVVLVGNPEQPQAIEPRRELHCPSRARSRRASTISPPTRAGKPALSSSRKESFPTTAELCAMRDHPRNGPLARRGGWIGHQLAHDRLARARVGTGT
jgi:ATP-dependent exoDNAse (exonuclease V) alpha subunit